MSDFLATLYVDGQPFELVSWDRPVWFPRDQIDGFRIVPDIDHMLIDGIATFALGAFDGLKDMVKYPIELIEVVSTEDLQRARQAAYAIPTDHLELKIRFDGSLAEFEHDLSLMVNGLKVTFTEEDDGLSFGPPFR